MRDDVNDFEEDTEIVGDFVAVLDPDSDRLEERDRVGVLLLLIDSEDDSDSDAVPLGVTDGLGLMGKQNAEGDGVGDGWSPKHSCRKLS